MDGYINYQVSNFGRIKNSKTGRIMKQSLHKCGYLTVCLSRDCICKVHYVHQLIAQKFLQKPDNVNKYMVCHIDHDRENHQIDNLKYLTNQQNQMRQVKRPDKPSTSVFKGVSHHKVMKK